MEKIQCWKFSALTGLEKMKFGAGKEPQTLDEASLSIPPGAYTTFRTYKKIYALHFTFHLARLEETARITNHIILLDENTFRLKLRTVLSKAPWTECRVRVTLDLDSSSDSFFIFLEKLHIPTLEQYRCGVRVNTIRAQRENPKAKLSSFLPMAASFREKSIEAVYETLMAGDNGEVLEGLSSNFFSIKDGRIRTAGSGVLMGITRTYVLEIAEKLCIPVSQEGVRMDEIASLEEAFITSSSRGILPVVQIDCQKIGKGKPGPITKKLSDEFLRRLEENLEKV
ncbi:MAG: aminotransferase class IV [Anaerolineaceae bacterium]